MQFFFYPIYNTEVEIVCFVTTPERYKMAEYIKNSGLLNYETL